MLDGCTGKVIDYPFSSPSYRSRVRLQQHVGGVPVDEEESEFPRGGKETLTPLEKRLIKEQAQKDVLFDEVGLVQCAVYWHLC